MSVLSGMQSKLKDMPARGWILLALLAALAIALIGASGIVGTEGDKRSALETRLERVLSRVEGAGEVSAMVIEGDNGATGVLIVAEGAGDLQVRLTLQNAVKTLLGIDNSNIDIVRMEGEADEAG